MGTTVTKLSIFVFLVAAMTTLPIGATTTFAASKINNHHHIQLMSNDDSWLAALPIHLIRLVLLVVMTLAGLGLYSMHGIIHTTIITQQHTTIIAQQI